jgi:hypothetical protein
MVCLTILTVIPLFIVPSASAMACARIVVWFLINDDLVWCICLYTLKEHAWLHLLLVLALAS